MALSIFQNFWVDTNLEGDVCKNTSEEVTNDEKL